MQTTSTIPDLAELVGFFECEPTLLDEGVPWFVNRLTFATVRVGVAVLARLEPAEGLFDVSLQVADEELATAQIRALGEMRLRNERGRETLSVRFGEHHESTLWLTLKPSVRMVVEGRDGAVP